MKNLRVLKTTLIFTLANVLILTSLSAQTPEKMSYQAVVRDAGNNLVTGTQVGMQISILQNTTEGTTVYTETQMPTTNANGLITIEIGTGTVVTGDFSTIDWGADTYFIKTEIDLNGGTDYSITGTSQLLSVPYALYAKTANTLIRKKNGRIYNTYMSDDGTFVGLPEIEVEQPFKEEPTVTDIDNNIYGTVKIGTQVWMTENLKTIHYNNGSPIPIETDGNAWGGLTTPAYCWYYNDSLTYASKYGALYNWYTVRTDKLCPEGWHVPDNDDWSILINYLGSIVGGRMKESSTIYWSNPNNDALNDSRFTALPGGCRYLHEFVNVNYVGYWWSRSSTEENEYSAFGLRLVFSDGEERFDGHVSYKYGYSVRCIRD